MIRAKKSLGQNWLKSKAILSDIIKAGEVKIGDTVLEVGPGQGVLTEVLLAADAKVVAVEKDDRLIELLQAKFANEIKTGQLTLVHGDILNLDIKNLKLSAQGGSDSVGQAIKQSSYKLIANLPYYITGQFLRQTLESDCPPSLMVLMLQKEVAERIAAKNGRESILSISVKVYGTPKYVKTVSKKFFSPQPSVDSAILKIDRISKDFFTRQNFPKKNLGGRAGLSEVRFFELVKKGFGQKRKMLKGNLALPESVLVGCSIPVKARAEELNLGDWYCLAKQLQMSNYK